MIEINNKKDLASYIKTEMLKHRNKGFNSYYKLLLHVYMCNYIDDNARLTSFVSIGDFRLFPAVRHMLDCLLIHKKIILTSMILHNTICFLCIICRPTNPMGPNTVPCK